MIIVSQDREEILNFDNYLSLSIDKEPFGELYMILATTNNYQSSIAIYKTKERAKEVLEEILKNYESKLLIRFKGYLSNEHEKLLLKRYEMISKNTSVFVSDERKDIEYIPCNNNVYYMPEK